MGISDKLNETNVSRRGFLKGMTAIGATAAIYGCGGDGSGGQTYLEESEETRPTAPEISGTVVPGAAPHNCGGRCVTKAYVENGVIKRFVTDERPDENLIDGNGEDHPQLRACVRCRSNLQRFYRSDRILTPLKQTGERGDVNGFVKISWDQATREIADKLQQIKNEYGTEALYNHYASGDGNEMAGAASCSGRLLNTCLGGYMTYRNDYSWPSLEHTSWFFFGQNFYFPPEKSRQDAFNADTVVVWSGNFAESIWGTNTAWYLQQLKEMDKDVIVVDSRYSKTASTQASRYIPVHPGSDAALIAGMMYHLITKTWDENGNKIGNYLDEEFILKYTHGFFDDVAYEKYPSIAKTYHSEIARDTGYVVPNGASMSAYIMGNDDRLVDAGLNGATSIYPYDIGYNNYKDTNDTLYNARVPIYGQEPKTPEWAEKVSGLPADTIRELAEIFANNKVTTWLGGGFQRQSEGEQGPLNCYALGVITKNFGEPGRHVGVYTDRQPISFGLAMPGGDNSVVLDGIYDTTRLTAPNYTPLVTRNTFPVFMWPDVAKNGGTGESMFNDGQVKNMPTKMKALMNFGGNCLVNQCGDYNTISEIIKDKSNIELIVNAEQFMTPSAKFSDYILPAATAFEKEGACTGWLAGDALTCMNKGVEPQGEAKAEYDICSDIADKMGLKSQFTEGKTVDDWRRESVEPILNGFGANMTYEEWKEIGTFSLDESYGITDPLSGFRTNPASNPLFTPTGKFEIYSQAMVEDYEARFYDNIDRSGKTLENSGVIVTKGTGSSNSARYVYPIPMYIPMMEGAHKHAVTGEIIDPEGLGSDYPFVLNGWHFMYRSHSTHNNNAYMNEVYKKNAKGQEAFLDYSNRTYKEGPWDANVYEPIWINSSDAQSKGINNGDRVIVESPRGRIYASAVVTNRIRPGMLGIGQGGWANGDNKDGNPDIGGAINVLTKLRPARICQGMTLGADTRVNIRKG
ncbi:MAG: molybdopterin-dependent oxidoreductase [Flexistipes sinusarabici]|uniref:Molybdopterin-dependent oxidoreductase n=1 Tax=Flexistipes sinusarabici TaxID=2352 RepID=A0A5D0MM08_FLESI|nr:molybdopterin-dependent oxidoreductase [Flexistipes sinusarabici]TYB32480.1 MAG: molybdopterin-dependent oxidoreductase [Flexistipes sinusarabici]